MKPVFENGAAIARYRVLSRIGTGGMGEVYEAHDPTLDRSIALKILPPDLVSNGDRLRRFVQEAKTASALSHPHIVTIHEVGEVDLAPSDVALPMRASLERVHYIAMELVAGVTLKERIHEEESDLREVLRWLSQAADALAKAHGAGVIHRDLKPENIMITRDGYAKVLDFGLAKLVEERNASTEDRTEMREEHTREGTVLGTVGYMAPEQVQGRSVDHRADIFSFGCILYEATTRRKPFVGDSNVDTMHQILHSRPQPVGELNPEAPAELRRMIRRCLAKDPDKRIQSMKDLALELAEMVEEFEQLSAESASRSSSSGLSYAAVPHRKSSWLLLAAATLIVLLAASSAYLWLSRPAASFGEIPEFRFSQLTDAGGAEIFPTISPDGNFVAYSGQNGDERDIFLLRVGGRNPMNLTAGVAGSSNHPAFSPDNQQIAFRSEAQGGGIFVMGTTGEAMRRVSDFGFHPAWSPDGTKLVVCTEGPPNPYARSSTSALHVIDLVAGSTAKIYDGDAVNPRWSPDGRRIAFWGLPDPSGGQRDIGTIAADGGSPVWLTSDAPLDWNPIWSPDGKFIYFASDRGGSLNLWRVGVDPANGAATGRPQPITTPSLSSGMFAISADGRRLVYSAAEGRSHIATLPLTENFEVAGAATRVTRGSANLTEASVSPDGNWLVARTAGEHEDLVILRTDGSESRRLTEGSHRNRGPSWSPDSKRIFFYSNREGRYEIFSINIDGGNLSRLTQMEGRSLWYPTLSPDGRWLAAFNDYGTALFDLSAALPAREPALRLDSEETPHLGAAWSPSGRLLAAVRVEPSILRPVAIEIYSLETKQWRPLPVAADQIDPFSLAWLDERKLVVVMANRLAAIDVESGSVRELYASSAGTQLGRPHYSTRNRSLFFVEMSNEADIWLAELQTE